MQFVFVFPAPGYVGSASSPTLQLLDFDVSGILAPGAHTPVFALSNAHYSAQSATPAELVGSLADEVAQLEATGVLEHGNANALLTKLQNALKSLEKGNSRAAVGQLLAFINQVEDFIAEGRLSAEEGQALIDGAQTIIDQLGP